MFGRSDETERGVYNGEMTMGDYPVGVFEDIL
jgi:hypothetical protein